MTINALFDNETNMFQPIDPTLPLWANLEELWLEEQPENLYCEEKDFQDLRYQVFTFLKLWYYRNAIALFLILNIIHIMATNLILIRY